MKTVEITVILTGEQAWDLAQHLKRAGFNDYRRNAVSDEEAYRMLEAGEIVRRALAEEGYAPR